MSSLKFGTSGLRGLVSELLGVPTYAYVHAFCEVMREDGAGGPQAPMMIARDLRASSPDIARQCAQAITDAGFSPLDCGAAPTPALALAAMQRGAPAIMVTGSHIPEDRNGLKFYRADGEISKDDEMRITAWRDRLAIGAAPETTVTARTLDVLTAYCNRYRQFFGSMALSGLNVGVYQHSSVARDIICEVLASVGARPVALGRAASFIPVDTEALRPEDIALARRWAAQQRLDAIVSTDGDADRPLIADATGEFLRGDLIGAMTAATLGADAIVTPVTSNSALEQPGLFRKVWRTRVGSPHVIAGMIEASASGSSVVVGFEANGGVLLGSDVSRAGRTLRALPTRDAMLPILACLSLITQRNMPLAALAAEMNFCCAMSGRLQNVDPERSATLIRRLNADDASFRNAIFGPHSGVAKCDQRDGLRLSLDDGATIHFRGSGNAPELRVYVEAEDETVAEKLLAAGLAFAARETACELLPNRWTDLGVN